MHETTQVGRGPSTGLVRSLLNERHPVPLSIALHLLPGVLIWAAYVLLGAPLAAALGYPVVFGYLLVTPLVFVPAELGLLCYLGWKRNGRWSLAGIVAYRGTPLGGAILGALVVGLLVWTVVSSALLAPLDTLLYERIFAWAPSHLFLGSAADTPLLDYPRTTTIITLLVWLVVGAISLPTIEEYYFRGYLLPRLAYLGRWAPVLNMTLFATYHVWSPWQIVSRIAFFLPTVWATWRYQDLRISLWVHCLGNVLGVLLTLAAVIAVTR